MNTDEVRNAEMIQRAAEREVRVEHVSKQKGNETMSPNNTNPFVKLMRKSVGLPTGGSACCGMMAAQPQDAEAEAPETGSQAAPAAEAPGTGCCGGTMPTDARDCCQAGSSGCCS